MSAALHPTRSLPEGYTLAREINLLRDRNLALGLNVAALMAFFLVMMALNALMILMCPGGVSLTFTGDSMLGTLALLVGLTVVNLVVHEAIHGLFFYVFTRTRPVFALRLAYAYAAAPDWYIPARAYTVIGLAPLILIDLVCLLLMLLVPAWTFALALVIGLNTSGAVGDLFIVGLVLRSRRDCLVNDRGDSVAVYAPSGG